MLIEEYDGNKLKEDIKQYFDLLAKVFVRRNYDSLKNNYYGRYAMSKGMIEEIYENVDFDYLLYTGEGNKEQDELIIKYFTSQLYNDNKELIDKYLNQNVYISENSEYIFDNKVINWEEIKKSICDINELKSYTDDIKGKSYKINIGTILILIYIFGKNRVIEFLEKKNKIYTDSFKVGMDIYVRSLEKYDISSIMKIEDNAKVVYPVDKPEDKEFMDKIDKKDDFIGQSSEFSIEDLKNMVKDTKILDFVLEYLKYKNNNKVNNDYDISKEKNNESIINNKIIPNETKYIINRNNDIEQKLNEKYEKDYHSSPSKYIEKTTNRKIDKETSKDIDNILEEYNNQSKDQENKNLKSEDKNLGDLVKQKGFNTFRKIEDVNKEINLEEVLYMLINKDNKLTKIEQSLGKYSCKYIKESFVKRGTSFLKNLFLSKVNDYVNSKLDYHNIGFNVDFREYDYLEFGEKDIDDIKVIGYEKLINILVEKRLVKESYRLDSKGIRIYPRFRRIMDNVIEEYIKRKCKLVSSVDGVNEKQENIFRKYLLFLDEKKEGLKKEDYKTYINMGKEISLVNLIYTILKNKIEYREESLKYISSQINKNYKEYVKRDTKSKDSKLMKSIFPNVESMKNFFKIKNLSNISFFLKPIYTQENIKKNILSKVVTDSAKVYCSFGVGFSNFIGLTSKSLISGEKLVSIKDKKIKPFCSCSVCKQCVPNIVGDWNSDTNVMISGVKSLSENSTNFCVYGGVITLSQKFSTSTYNSNVNVKYKKENKNVEKNAPYTDMEDFKKNLNLEISSFYDVNSKLIIPTVISSAIKMKSILKPKLDEKNTNFNLPIYDSRNKKIYEMNDIFDVIKEYFLRDKKSSKGYSLYKKYGNNLQATDLVNEYIANAKNIDASDYIQSKHIDKNDCPWMVILESEYLKYRGQKEYTRNGGLNKKIIEYHKIGGGIDATYLTPWCASFTCWILRKVERINFTTPSSQNLRNILKKIDKAKYGAILILSRYNKNGERTSFGHVTFITDITDDGRCFLCLGGNQNNEIKYCKYKAKGEIKTKNGYLKIDGIYWPK